MTGRLEWPYVTSALLLKASLDSYSFATPTTYQSCLRRKVSFAGYAGSFLPAKNDVRATDQFIINHATSVVSGLTGYRRGSNIREKQIIVSVPYATASSPKPNIISSTSETSNTTPITPVATVAVTIPALNIWIGTAASVTSYTEAQRDWNATSGQIRNTNYIHKSPVLKSSRLRPSMSATNAARCSPRRNC